MRGHRAETRRLLLCPNRREKLQHPGPHTMRRCPHASLQGGHAAAGLRRILGPHQANSSAWNRTPWSAANRRASPTSTCGPQAMTPQAAASPPHTTSRRNWGRSGRPVRRVTGPSCTGWCWSQASSAARRASSEPPAVASRDATQLTWRCSSAASSPAPAPCQEWDCCGPGPTGPEASCSVTERARASTSGTSGSSLSSEFTPAAHVGEERRSRVAWRVTNTCMEPWRRSEDTSGTNAASHSTASGHRTTHTSSTREMPAGGACHSLANDEMPTPPPTRRSASQWPGAKPGPP
mmetsp:Transcript_50830/g.145230  ORF Transcript_50830/g.145230 Transcript_50830/m.145230 type:complete len:293 (+) Transcript_50830:72-950(+)